MERFSIDSPAVDQAQVANARLRLWKHHYAPQGEQMLPPIEEELIQALSEARLILPVWGEGEKEEPISRPIYWGDEMEEGNYEALLAYTGRDAFENASVCFEECWILSDEEVIEYMFDCLVWPLSDEDAEEEHRTGKIIRPGGVVLLLIDEQGFPDELPLTLDFLLKVISRKLGLYELVRGQFFYRQPVTDLLL